MTNYLLSIDPSIKNTGFTLWENKKPNYEELYNGQFSPKWKPILIISYNFKKYEIKTSLELKWKIRDFIIPNMALVR